jgi:hypothetical protein
MRTSHLAAAFLLLACPRRAAGQAAAPPPAEVIRLTGGSTLVGRVTAAGGGKIHLVVDGLGEVVIDSATVASRSPVPAPPGPLSPWSATVNGSVTHISTVVPGVAGSTFGAQITAGVARTGARGGVTLDGTVSYWRVEPDVAAVNQWGLTLGGRRILAPRWVLMGRSSYEANRVQYLQYRSTTIAGLGYFLVKSGRVSLLVAPGIGYGKSEQTALGRVLSFGAGTPPSVEGPITGAYDQMTWQISPTLSFQQDLHWFWSLGHMRSHQAQLNAQLLGMMNPHFGLSIAFKEQYDTSMPPSVNRTLRSLVSGVQLKL